MSKDRRDNPYDKVRKPTTGAGWDFETKKNYKRPSARREEEEMIEEGLQDYFKETSHG